MLTGSVKVPGPVSAEAEIASGGTMASSARWGLTGFVPSAAVVGLCFRLQAQKNRDKTANMNASPRRPTATRDRLITLPLRFSPVRYEAVQFVVLILER